ncbi:MAG TPA: isocitrate lyase/phosphoenolpyruvate mutase family protein [Caulobacteraceae bacterium]|jgi:2-methylisocitrate lyase-like PEP mutase family enzyme
MDTTVAEHFRGLHAGPEILILPNCWDTAGAAIMEAAGAKAVATSSAALAWAHGYPDGDVLPRPVLLAALREISRVITAPLTADIEGGFTDDLEDLADLIAAVIDAGAVGVNLEDGRRPPELHARKLEAARKAADRAGVPLFINARTDVYLERLAEGEAAFNETVARAELYRGAGADGVFVPWPAEAELIGRLAAAIALPLNVMGRAGVPGAATLRALGVRRVSSGARPFRGAYGALAHWTADYLRRGDAGVFDLDGAAPPDFNARFASLPQEP